jgi:hypothetical protein
MRAVCHGKVLRVVTERSKRLHGLELKSPSRMRAVPHYHSATTLGTILESTRVVTERSERLHGLE